MEDPYPVENLDRLGVLMSQTSDNSQLLRRVQCNPDIVTSYLVTNPNLVTILQKTIFLVHKSISFSDNLVFSAAPI